jgi:hypothetical protein
MTAYTRKAKVFLVLAMIVNIIGTGAFIFTIYKGWGLPESRITQAIGVQPLLVACYVYIYS